MTLAATLRQMREITPDRRTRNARGHPFVQACAAGYVGFAAGKKANSALTGVGCYRRTGETKTVNKIIS